MSGSLIIKGGKRLGGVHRVSGNKNAALPMIAAALLSEGPVTLENVPDIADVAVMLEAAHSFGARVVRDLKRERVTLETPRLRRTEISPLLATKLRASILFAGPLLARAGRASLPVPGGDQIGHRRLDTHIVGLRRLGAKPLRGTKNGRRFSFRAEGGLKGARLLLDEASVTATENLMMAAALAKGTTEIYNAACEPHVVDLARMLLAMGVKIEGVGTNRLLIEGTAGLPLKGCTARIGCDYIEAGSYLVAAAVTGGTLTLTNVEPEPFEIIESVFARFGVTWKFDDTAHALTYTPKGRLRMRYDLGDAIPSVADGVWPAFPSDLMSVLIILATQTRGTCLFFEKLFESRLYFVDSLRQMGAKIVQCDPHRIVVTGPSALYASRVASPDIRAGIALVIAALAAKGESVIGGIETIDRGYASVERAFANLGAEISRR